MDADDTQSPDTQSPRDRAVAAVNAILRANEALNQANDNGYMIVLPAREIVEAVHRALGDKALLLPRYYPADEGQAWPLGPASYTDPDTGLSPHLYASWETGLPDGRMRVRVSDATRADPPVLAEFTADPASYAEVLRQQLAACDHSAATRDGGA